jgi:hypothetical protein
LPHVSHAAIATPLSGSMTAPALLMMSRVMLLLDHCYNPFPPAITPMGSATFL